MRSLARAIGLFGLTAVLLAGGTLVERAISESAQPVFSEIKWPFPIDQWGFGRAYRCTPGQCGTEVTLFLRTKVGFCNCASGIADDNEIDRVADFDLLQGRVQPLGAGKPVTVAEIPGRTRLFRIEGKAGSYALVIALSEYCDGFVATAVLEREPTPAIETAITNFLTPARFNP